MPRTRLLAVTLLALGTTIVPATAQAAPSPVQRACGVALPGSVRCFGEFRPQPNSARHPGGSVPKPTAGYGPADIASMYGLDPRSSGGTLAIVDAFDNPNVEADLGVFRSAFGLPPCTTRNGCFRKVNQRGGSVPPAPDAGWGVEIDLDVQAVSAACPRCRILLVEADSPTVEDIAAAVDRAVALGAKVISNSYGGDEFAGVLELGAAHYSPRGVAMVVSSGDAGFGPASFPASWGTAIAVGGTTVTRTASGWTHAAWIGSGSGCSAWVRKPSWQHDKNCLMRTTTDIAALGDPDTGLAVYDSFLADFGQPPQWIVAGGTSLSAPLVAGMIALARNPSEMTDARRIYNHPRGLRDVTTGSNAIFNDCGGDYLCTSGRGYDGPTGMGTPRGLGAL